MFNLILQPTPLSTPLARTVAALQALATHGSHRLAGQVLNVHAPPGNADG